MLSDLRCPLLLHLRVGAPMRCRCVLLVCQLVMTLSGMVCVRQLLWMRAWCLPLVALCLAWCRLLAIGRLRALRLWMVTVGLLVVCLTMCHFVCGALRATCCVVWLRTVLLVVVSWRLVGSLRWQVCQWALMGSRTRLTCVQWRVSMTLMWLHWIAGTLVRRTVLWWRCHQLMLRWRLRASLRWCALPPVVMALWALLMLRTIWQCATLRRRCV